MSGTVDYEAYYKNFIQNLSCSATLNQLSSMLVHSNPQKPSVVPQSGKFDYEALYKQSLRPLTYSGIMNHMTIKSISKPRLVFQDIFTFTLKETDLKNYKPGKNLYVGARDVPCSNDIRWWIMCYPAGGNEDEKNHLSLYLHVNKPVQANYNFKVGSSHIDYMFSSDFSKANGWGTPKMASHDALRPLFVDGCVTITCQVEFEISGTNAVMAPRIGQSCAHVPTDVDLVVGSKRLKVHKSLLSLVSPVFHAMLTNDTVEAPSEEIEVTDFDYGTVKSAIDFCYGRALENTSVKSIIGTLRFADKYRIEASPLEQVVISNLKPKSFVSALKYADGTSDSLFFSCCEFFERNASAVTATASFASLPSKLISSLLKNTFDLNTDLEVLRSAHKNGIKFVLDEWEKPVVEALSLENFCDTCKYAWDCSRDNLKKECGKFFNANKAEIITMKDFINLSPVVAHGVLKSAFELL